MFNADFADPTLPNVLLTIGGKERKLCFDYAAMVTAEKLSGANLLRDTFEASFSTIGPLLYAALLHDDPTVTLEQVGKWINFRSAPVVYQAILSAWLGSTPEPKGDDAMGEAPAQDAITAA